MSERYDVAVVGAGIVGLAHAWHLARRGERVLVLERGPRAEGASVRNFGMIWPIGQPVGERRDLALRSREIWGEVVREAGLWHDSVGSLHVACHDDELAVLEEFVAAGEPSCEMWSTEQACERSPGLRRDRVRGAMFSAVEMLIDPREVLARLPVHLSERYGVDVRFGVLVRGYQSGVVHTSDGSFDVHRMVVCGGAEQQVLYPELLAEANLHVCKLQMMRTGPQPGGWRLGPMLAGGLTLGHYASFAGCPSLPALVERFERELPDHRRHGIHVMAAQNGLGEVVLGDSHHFGDEVTPFDRADVERRILEYLDGWLDLPDGHIAARWHGQYATYTKAPALVEFPEPRVSLVTGLGGAGMTLSFAIAERVVAGLVDSAKLA